MFSSLFVQVTLTVVTVLSVSLKNDHVKDNFGIKRFLHGCPFAFPCPPPPCDNPVFGPRDCCGSCPEPTTIAPRTSQVLEKKSKLGNHAKKSFRRKLLKNLAPGMTSLELRDRQFTTATYPTTTACPYQCVHQGYHYCHPLPCHITCVDGVKQPGDCCYSCPNGPNCMHENRIIPEGKNVTLPSGDVAYCSQGDVYGGHVRVYQFVG